MKLFKNIDDKFKDIGFELEKENKFGVRYKRKNTEHNYTQILHLLRKLDGKHLIQSYDPDLFDKKCIGNTGVGLTMYEAKLCLKKMKSMGWKIKKY